MENKLERKYGLFTAICMVVGIVIGSGVFFKAQTILEKSGGNMPLGILAWIIGGVIMIVCILAFAVMAQKYEKVNGIVDYSEATVGKGYAYYMGWFLSTTYYPNLTVALAWLSARYTLTFITSCWPQFPLLIPAAEGGCVIGPECMALTLFFLVCAFAVNTLSPKLAGKFQTTTTVIKLIPLGLMAIGGIFVGLISPTHMLVSNFATANATVGMDNMEILLTAVCATSFAYEGWIIATSINAELKDAKKNLPKALIIGGIVIIAVYVCYYIGVAGGASVNDLIENGATLAFTNVFGGVLGNILNLFVAISCMGTMNGLMLGCSRGMYALAARNDGPNPEMFGQVDKKSNMPHNAAVIGLVFCAAWGLYFFLSNLFGTFQDKVILGGAESTIMVFDPTELPIITIYAMYLPIFIMWMKKETDQTPVRRFVLPILAMIGSLFMVYACIVSHKWGVMWYLIVFAAIMLVGVFFRKRQTVSPELHAKL